jgi:inorganic pyrophosphatase
MTNTPFWATLDELVATSEIIIDRPCGTVHPRYPDICYPLDYGYLHRTRSGDGDGIDVWVGSLPEKHVTGAIVTVDLAKRDSEIKILWGCTSEEMALVLAFHNGGSQMGIFLLCE